MLEAVGIDPPTDDNRRAALGSLGGIAAGLGVGVAASVVRALGLRVSAPAGAVLTGAAAMAATDLPMAATGVSDLRTWSGTDWVRDAVPHLAYGIGVRWTLDRLAAYDASTEVRRDRRPVTPGLLGRAAMLGAAAGGRTSLGVGGPMLGHGTLARVLATGLVGTELVMDKLPSTPSRLLAPVLGGRLGAGAVGAGVLARRERANVVLPVLAGALGAFGGSVAGAAWREVAEQRGLTWQSAAAEDAVAMGLTWLAVRGTRA